MSNTDTIELLEEMKKLMTLRGENPFKIRAFEKAVSVLEGLKNPTELRDRAKAGSLTALPGIGKGIAEVLTDYLLTGQSKALNELRAAIPPGLAELAQVRGLGPKKAMILIEELGIRSLVELEYACKENRLVQLKGFGPKIQEKLAEEIQFRNAHRGLQKLSEALEISHQVQSELRKFKAFKLGRVEETGALRRRLEIVGELEFLIELGESELDLPRQQEIESALRVYISSENCVLPIRFHFASAATFGYEWARTTSTMAHWQELGRPGLAQLAPSAAVTEELFYGHFALPWLPPEVRETGEEIEWAKRGELPKLLPEKALRGIFHNHTTRSDGSHSLEQMVAAAVDLGLEYIGISDHSQTAFYAQGLREETLKEQRLELNRVQEKFPQIRIFWGIESDILGDGSLDYNDEILSRFDFVVASIHSRFQMDKKAMTERVLRALRNPYTRFLGHPTGRLLLGRKPFDLDMPAVIQAAVDHSVAIELNANPARLDIDWRWGPELRKRSAMVSIHPDAHSVDGLKDTAYGVMMARKALLPIHSIVNTKSVAEVEKWLKRV